MSHRHTYVQTHDTRTHTHLWNGGHNNIVALRLCSLLILILFVPDCRFFRDDQVHDISDFLGVVPYLETPRTPTSAGRSEDAMTTGFYHHEIRYNHSHHDIYLIERDAVKPRKCAHSLRSALALTWWDSRHSIRVS
jgi:hypothetical protein